MAIRGLQDEIFPTGRSLQSTDRNFSLTGRGRTLSQPSKHYPLEPKTELRSESSQIEDDHDQGKQIHSHSQANHQMHQTNGQKHRKSRPTTPNQKRIAGYLSDASDDWPGNGNVF